MVYSNCKNKANAKILLDEILSGIKEHSCLILKFFVLVITELH